MLSPNPLERLLLAKTSAETQGAAVLGRAGLNTIIASIQHEDSGGQEPECVERAYIRIYKGPAESRSGLCRSIVTMVQPAESLL